MSSFRIEALLRIAPPLIFHGAAVFIDDDVSRNRCIGLPHLIRYFSANPAADLLLPAGLWARQNGGRLGFFLDWFRRKAASTNAVDMLEELNSIEARLLGCGKDLLSTNFHDMNSFAIWNGTSVRARKVAWFWLSDLVKDHEENATSVGFTYVGFSFSFALAPIAAQVPGFHYEITRYEYQYSSDQRCACSQERALRKPSGHTEDVALRMQTFESCSSYYRQFAHQPEHQIGMGWCGCDNTTGPV